MYKWTKKIWHWHWLLTVPVTLFFLYWLWTTLNYYATFNVRYNPKPVQYSLLGTGRITFNHIIRKNKLAFFDTFSRDNELFDNELKKIHLFVSEADLAELDSNLPQSGQDYKRARMLHGEKLKKVKIRYRGDYAYHWAFPKKSFRVKTPKKSLFEGFRRFNLIAPKRTNNYFSYRLATLMGAISPHAEMVGLYLNGRSHGTFLFNEQLEELMLRQQKLMPGDLYSGDNVGKDSYYPLSPIFKTAGIWKKISANNHYPLDSKKPLEKLIDLVNLSSHTDISKSMHLLFDMDEWGRFSALETLMQSHHYDNLHNWRLYYDPYRCKFKPVVWDPVGWFFAWVPSKNKSIRMDILPSDLHKALFKNADFIRARHNAIESFFTSGTDQIFIKEVNQVMKILRQSVETDPKLKMSPNRRKLHMRLLKKNIKRVFNEVREKYIIDQGDVRYKPLDNNAGFSLQVSGRKPVKNLIINHFNPVRGEISAQVNYWQNSKKIEQDVSGAVSINGDQLKINVPFIARFIPINDKKIDIQPAYYELLFTGIQKGNPFMEMLVDWGGEPVPATSVDEIQKVEFHDMYSMIHARPVKQPEIWKGVVKINNVREINEDLILQPGTIVRLGPGAGLILRGRLIANGTKEKPVRFLPEHEDQKPWSTIALIGNRSKGSYLSYCEFAGGSGLKGDLYEYTAMLSVHDVSGVRVSHCRFRDNKIVDDMVHVVYSDIHFFNCLFERAHLDALDLDISDAVIEQCHFLNSGNDAIDLMMAQSAVLDSLLKGSGDKGISVGENSRLFAVNTHIVDNEIGLQSKDTSVASLFNITLDENRLALDAYKKNWRYNGGGKIYLYKGKIVNNQNLIKSDKHSLVKVYDTYLDDSIKKMKNISIDKHTDIQKKKNELDFNWRYAEEIQQMQGFESLLERIDRTRKGSSEIAAINWPE